MAKWPSYGQLCFIKDNELIFFMKKVSDLIWTQIPKMCIFGRYMYTQFLFSSNFNADIIFDFIVTRALCSVPADFLSYDFLGRNV